MHMGWCGNWKVGYFTELPFLLHTRICIIKNCLDLGQKTGPDLFRIAQLTSRQKADKFFQAATKDPKKKGSSSFFFIKGEECRLQTADNRRVSCVEEPQRVQLEVWLKNQFTFFKN